MGAGGARIREGHRGTRGGIRIRRSPRNPLRTCDTDWHKCADNRDLLEHYNRYKLFAACEMEAENLVKFREPKWPGIIGGGACHDRFLEGDSYIKFVGAFPRVFVLVGAVTSQQAREAEIRSIAAEMVGSLRIVSEGVNPLTKVGMRALCLELEHELTQLCRLSDQLP
jgi:hypothetical protein